MDVSGDIVSGISWERVHPASVEPEIFLGGADEVGGASSADSIGEVGASGADSVDEIAAAGAIDSAPVVGGREQNWALQGIGLNSSDCANGGTGPCTRGAVLNTIVEFAGAVGASDTDTAAHAARMNTTNIVGATKAVETAAAVLGCDSEICVLNDPRFRRFAQTQGVGSSAIAAEKESKFKPFGPKNTTELLNNYHIDSVMQRWARESPAESAFFAHPFAMMDFHKTGDDFDTVDLVGIYEGRVPQLMGAGFASVTRPCRTFGCVLNTDTSSGPGKHWITVFVDMRGGKDDEWTVEFFNSAGRPPPTPLVEWMERQRRALATFRAESKNTGGVSSVIVAKPHQHSETECGLFSLYYNRRRLLGDSYKFFLGERITDEAMKTFRQLVFRSQK